MLKFRQKVYLPGPITITMSKTLNKYMQIVLTFFLLFRNRNNKQGTSYDPTEDEDVRDERENIENNENNSADTLILKIHKLTKIFRRSLGHRNIAVNNISVGVKSGEVRIYIH